MAATETDAETDAGDFDAQDAAEAYDEETTYELETDSPRGVFDSTSALGDEDVEGDDDALDADEEDDGDLDDIAEVSDQQEEDDLDDDDSDDGPLSVDNIPDDTNDRDFADDDAVDGVSGHELDEADVVSMGDVDALGGAATSRMADVESTDLSDSDLVELDYKEA